MNIAQLEGVTKALVRNLVLRAVEQANALPVAERNMFAHMLGQQVQRGIAEIKAAVEGSEEERS